MSHAFQRPGGAHVVVIGAGNIASHFVSHVGRMQEVGRVTIIDRDRYEAKNLVSQDIVPADVGKPKARVQGRRVRRINPALSVAAIAAPVEGVPPGRLAGDVIVAGLDNRRARQHVNDAAWQLGVPWIDAAVDARDLLVRVGVYVPGEDQACLECGWNDRDYEALEQAYPCDLDRDAEAAAAAPATGAPSGLGAAPAADAPSALGAATDAPSGLGALAAALQAIECRKILRGEAGAETGGRQIFFDLRHHQYYCSTLSRNPACRRADHTVWNLQDLDRDPRDVTLEDVMQHRPAAASHVVSRDGTVTDHVASLRVNQHRWVRRMVCTSCSTTRTCLRVLRGSLLEITAVCPRCRGVMRPSGFDAADALSTDTLSPAQRRCSLHALGIRPGDILSLEHAGRTARRLRITCDGV